MATIDEIKQQAEAVKNATQVGENTATRVGGALAGLADIAKQQGVALGKKADKETMDVELGKKADKETVNTELGKKANTTDVDTKFTEEKKRVDAELAKKFDKESIVQESGDAEDKVMSQKAVSTKLSDLAAKNATKAEKTEVTAELEKKFDKESILQESGDAEDKVMSQKATTTAIADETTRAKAAEEAIVFDVSVYNNGLVFESLKAILSSSNLNTLIPTSVRHGGMTIRFIQSYKQSSDNKYVQARCMAQNFTTDVTQWQGVDTKPLKRSHNLVESGGVVEVIKDTLSKDIEEDGFYICDAKGNVLIRLDVLDTKGGVGESLANAIRSIIQEIGATGFDSLEAKEIGTNLSKIINSFKDVKEVEEEGFYICNGGGEAIAKYAEDKWEFLGLKTGGTIPRKGAENEKYARLSAGTYILGNFPKYLKMGRTVTLSADVEQFGTIEIGVINTTKRTIMIDATNVILATDGSSRKTEAHGLTISGQLRVTFVADMFEAKAIIDCNGEQYIFNHTSNSHAYANNLDCSAYGDVGMIVGGSTILNNVILSASSNYFGKDVWIFGDSYTSIESGSRWANQVLFNFGYRNFMICGLAGGSSAQLYADLEKCLHYGTPKEIIWLLGMNNGDLADAPNPSWLENLEKVENICKEKGIELVLGTIPCTNKSTNDNSFKNEVIKSRGHRYINFAKAVGAEIKGSSWYEGMKESDQGIHPSELGAKVLAAQILADCPELTK